MRKQNFSIDREEHVEGMIALAIPVRNNTGKLYCTVSFHAPVSRMNLEAAMQYVPRLHQAAAELAKIIE